MVVVENRLRGAAAGCHQAVVRVENGRTAIGLDPGLALDQILVPALALGLGLVLVQNPALVLVPARAADDEAHWTKFLRAMQFILNTTQLLLAQKLIRREAEARQHDHE